MAIYSSNEGGVEREIRLQGTDDTNPTITTQTLVGTINLTTGYDALWTFTRKNEHILDNPPHIQTVLQSNVYGYNGLFSNQSGVFSTMFWQTWEDIPQVNPPSGYSYAISDNVDTSSISNIGSLSSYSFTSNLTHSITALCWGKHITNSTPSAHNNIKWVVLALDGAYNFYNIDATFKYLTIEDDSGGTIQLNRTDATFNHSENGDSTWCWLFNTSSNTVVDDLGTPTTAETREVKFYNETTATYNTGIAEEMGGADSADVKMSDYYKNGTFHNTSGIPVSGELKFSDFFDKTFVGLYKYQVSYQPDYWDRGVSSGVAERFSGWSDRSGWLGNVTYDGHRDTNETAVEPTSTEREFPDGVTFCNLSNSGGNKLKFTALTANGGYVYTGNTNPVPALYTFSVTYPGNVTSTATNSGWTTVKAWEDGTGSASSPAITLNRSDANFSETYYSGSNITELLYTWADENVTFGTGYSNTYSSVFGSSLTASNNDTWVVQID